MAKYIALCSWTDQGVKNIKDSPSRLDSAKGLAKKLGCEIKKFYMTIGSHDMIVVMEAPNDETMARFALNLASGGHVRTTTLKAFSEESYRKIVGGL